ncbi:hypothetical protein P7C70_g3643, partial [Phenoliferia sp. Uapishka_3]
MSAFFRTVAPRLRPSRLSSGSSFLQHTFTPSTSRQFTTTLLRSAVSEVANQPGSKSFSELGSNAKEEAAKVAKNVGDVISGANERTSVVSELGEDKNAMDDVKADLVGLESWEGQLGELGQTIPKDALIFGGAGLLPYMGTSFATIYLARQAGIASSAAEGTGVMDVETALALLHHVELLQIQYGAIILSFLGALHWGFEFAAFGGQKGKSRYLLGIAPVMVGWGSLLIPGTQVALIAQWVGFNAMWFVDQKATNHGWAPKWYSTYRFGLTAVVGSAILLSLAGSSYYGPEARDLASKTQKALHANTALSTSLDRASSKADIKLEASDTAFVKFTDMKKVREEEEKKEKKKAEEEEVETEKRRKEALAKRS